MPNGRRSPQLVTAFKDTSFLAAKKTRASIPWSPQCGKSERNLTTHGRRSILVFFLLPSPVLLLVLPVNPVERHASDFADDEQVVAAEARRRPPLPLAVLVGAGQ